LRQFVHFAHLGDDRGLFSCQVKPAVRLRLGVGKVTDADPPFIDSNSAADTDVATYRLLGRT
jgi:hypothetical protein